VADVQEIEQTIGSLDAISTAIAAAVVEQGSATAAIAHSVSDIHSSANDVTQRIATVADDAEYTGLLAADVESTADGLAMAMQSLREMVTQIVSTATTELDRRRMVRYLTPGQSATISADGQSLTAKLINISAGGAALRSDTPFEVGSNGILHIADVGAPLGYSVRGWNNGLLRVAFAIELAEADRLAAYLMRIEQDAAEAA
jgi:methyl-accepting chemotaxis protein